MRSFKKPILPGTLRALLASLAVLAWPVVAGAQTDPAPQALPYSQDFSGLPWTSTSYPAGLQGWRIGPTGSSFVTGGPTQDRSLVASGDASTSANGLYNFDGKIGPLSANGDNVALALALVATGRAGIVVSYDVTTIRNRQDVSNDRVNEITLQYRVGTSGSFTTIGGLEYQNLGGAGNDQTASGLTAPQNAQSRNVTLPASCDNQPVVQLRWVTREVSGAGDYPSFAIDNLTVTGTDWTITASAGPGGSITPQGVVPVPAGGSQSFTIAPALCHHIADVLVDGVSVGPVASYEFTDVQASHTIEASFALDSYTITALSSEGGSVSPGGPVSVNCGENQSFTITPAPCYDIADVMVDGVSVGPVSSYEFTNVQTNHSIGATFMLASYTITALSSEGGTISPGGSVNVECGGNQSFTITPVACYQIADVLVDGVSVGPVSSYEFTNVLSDHTIGATFALASYTITALSSEGGTISPGGSVNVECGGNQSFTLTPAACYHITDVLVDDVSVGPVTSYDFTNVQANHTIAASFARDSFVITASAGAGGTISPSGPVVVSCGANQSFTITPAACYRIADVRVDNVSVGPVASHEFTNVQANHTIEASFTLNSFTITASAGTGGTISPSGPVSVNCGSDQTFTIAPAACYRVADVLVDDVSVGAVSSYQFTNVQTHHTINASFVLGSHTITASASAGGSISPAGAVSMSCGANQSFSITANACYHIADVLVDSASVGAVASYQFTNVQSDHTIAASFAIDTHTITASAGTGGTISHAGVESVNCGANQLFTIVPGTCYRIADVVVDGNSIGPLATYEFTNVQEDHTISATFTIETFTIVTSTNGNGSITPIGPSASGPEHAAGTLATTFHVDRSNPSCSDVGPGTEAQPYCSISAAVSNHGGPGITIEVHPGTYRELVSVSSSGVSGSPFIIRASGPGAIIDGSDDLSNMALWTLFSGNVWRASSVSWTPKQVFMDGTRLTASTADFAALPANSFRAGADGLYVNAGGGNPGAHQLLVGRRASGFRLSGRSWVTVEGFTVARVEEKAIHVSNSSSWIVVQANTATLAGSNGIALVSSSDCEVRDNIVSNNGDHGILFSTATGSVIENNEAFGNARPTVRAANGIHMIGSSNNQVRRNRCHHNQDTGEHFSTGCANNASILNLSWSNGDHGFDHLRTTGTVHIGDVAYGNWKNGFSFEDNSTGNQLFDCIAIENGLNTNEIDLLVDPTSTTGFLSNSNIFWKSTSQALIQYGSTTYMSVAGYSAATGQDVRSLQSNPLFVNAAAGDFHLLPGSPAIDNADASLAAWPSLDYDGNSRVDDTATANQGLGPIDYGDRGAFEFLPSGKTHDVIANCGSSPSFSITAQPGYHVLNVKVDGQPVGATSTYTFPNLQANHTLEATFVPDPVAVFQPGIFDLRIDVDGIEIRWQLDRSIVVAEPELQRAEQAKGPWTPVAAERRRDGDVTLVLDRNVTSERVYYYRLVVQAADQQQMIFGPVQTRAAEQIGESALTQLGPNPAQGPVEIGFAVAHHERVRMSVLDIQGRIVDVLVDGAFRPGRYSLVWSGRGRNGARSPAGVYFLEYRSERRSSVRRFVLTR